MNDRNRVDRLKDLAYEMRRKPLYLCGHYEGSAYIEGDLSMADLLVGLFHHGPHADPENVSMEDKDRFIPSKGHGAVYMYTAMVMRGFFDYDEILSTYGKLDSTFGMCPYKVQLSGVGYSIGSLGHGLSMAIGMALSVRYKKQGYRVSCMLGDGETAEGSVWEATLTAPSYKLGDLIALIDRNKQLMTMSSEKPTISEPYGDRWKSFGRNVKEIDGYDMAQTISALDSLPSCDSHVPTAIVCHTVKGKGVSFMECNIGWHAGSLPLEDMEQIIAQVDAARCRERSVTS